MKWLEDAPEDWDGVDDDPPARPDPARVEDLPNGVAIRAPHDSGVYVYGEDESVVDVEDLA